MSEREIVVVTGASRGIGAVIAEDLARDGRALVLAARDGAGLQATAAKVEAAGGAALIVPCDLSQPEGRQRLLAEAEALGPVAALINNAGLEVAIAAIDQTDREVEQQITLNLTVPIHLSRAFLPGMIARKRGCIVMISSMSGKSPTPYNAVYSATKYGINGFTASLRLELDGTGVHAGVVCPGFVADAGMWSDTGVAAPALMKEVRPAAVAAGVRRVLAGASEVLVTAAPVRPMLALGQIFPNIDRLALRALGVTEALKKRAEVVLARR